MVPGLLGMLRNIDAALGPLPAQIIPERGFGQRQNMEEVRIVQNVLVMTQNTLGNFGITRSQKCLASTRLNFYLCR